MSDHEDINVGVVYESCDSCAQLRDRIRELEFAAGTVHVATLVETVPPSRCNFQLVSSIFEYFTRWHGAAKRRSAVVTLGCHLSPISSHLNYVVLPIQ